MKLKRYNDIQKLNEENKLKNLAVGAAAALGTILPSQAKSANISDFSTFDKDKTEILVDNEDKKKSRSTTVTQNKVTKSKLAAERLVQTGWTLDSTAVDTLFFRVKNERPDTLLHMDKAVFDGDNSFDSGKYILSQETTTYLREMFENIIAEGGTIMEVIIESSTDKQQLSSELQEELSSQGYEPSNKGLSAIRNDYMREYVEALGVNDSLITTNEKFEQGSQIIDRTHRYVSVEVIYLDKSILIEEFITEEPFLKTLYYLSKEVTLNPRRTNNTNIKLFRTTDNLEKTNFAPPCGCRH